VPPTASPGTVSPKQPRPILHEPAQPGQTPVDSTVFAFPPNRDTLGGTAYLIVEEVNILVDCPAWNADNQAFLEAQGGVDWLVLTHRGGMGSVRDIQQALHCAIAIQEQEAYLLPNLALTTFHQDLSLSPHSRLIWTPGHSPGSTCLYHSAWGGVLFSGRHLLPNPQGILTPLKTSKTFHWPRQLRNVQRLLTEFTPETLQKVCPGGNTGFLRGRGLVEDAYAVLQAQCQLLNVNSADPV
jgi:glyoxylase-like metal-dependent hydrolase (beta-lactamase superfamily II)